MDLAGVQSLSILPRHAATPLLSHCWDLHRAQYVEFELTRVNVNCTAASV